MGILMSVLTQLLVFAIAQIAIVWLLLKGGK
jgi:hypothetical protein